LPKSNLLARFANNTYWLGRYLERAENLARLLDINETYARDGKSGPNWQNVLDLYADTARFSEFYEEPDAESVLNFYIRDHHNPSSIYGSIASARENGRAIRHLISTEMWTHLNILHYRLSNLTRRDIWLTNVAQICADIRTDCQTFEGIAEGTFFRGEAWCFYQLGKYIERADQTTRVLDMGYDRLRGEDGEALAAVQRDVLLRSVSGYHAFKSRYPTSITPHDIAAFLLYDEQFPRAVTLCVNRVSERLEDLEKHHGGSRARDLEKSRKSLVFCLETGLGHRVTSRRLHKFLDDLQIALGQVSDEVGKTYFG